MKKILFFLVIMLAAGAVKAQTCELFNNSAQTVRVRLVAVRGSIEYFTDMISLPASSGMGPFTVASTSWPWSGPTPPAGAYVHVMQVEIPSCNEGFGLDSVNPIHTSCVGTTNEIKSQYVDIGGLSVEMHND